MNPRPFDGIVDNPKSISILVFESLVIGIIAISLGTIIDKVFKKISEKTKRFKLLVSIFQVIISAFITALIYIYGPTEFAMHFQTSLPGMLFPALFYGVQSNIYASWQQL